MNHAVQRVIEHIEAITPTWEGTDPDHFHRDTKLWTIAASSASFLEALVFLHQPKNILELGTSGGFSTLHLIRAAMQYGGHVHTIEHDSQKVALARNHFTEARVLDHVSTYHGDIFEIVEKKLSVEKIDFLFIDAEKAKYKQYVECVLPRLRPGALIIADNVSSHTRQVSEFTEYITKNNLFRSFLWKYDAGLYLAKYLP